MKDQAKPPAVSLIEEVVASREEKNCQEEEIAEAREKVPKLRGRVASLLRAHVPRPKVVKANWNDFRRDTRERFQTKLSARVPTTESDIEVNISASDYPKTKKGESIDFMIAIKGLDRYLICEGDEVRIESTETESSAPSYHSIVIGQCYPVYPAWEREATRKDMEQFLKLLDDLKNNPGVSFEGFTPDKPKFVLRRRPAR